MDVGADPSLAVKLLNSEHDDIISTNQIETQLMLCLIFNARLNFCTHDKILCNNTGCFL